MRVPDSHDDADGTVFRDVILLALLGFVTVVILLLPHLNPPTQATAAIDAPGNVVVEIRWPSGLDADVDLWVQAPGDTPVGYSNKGGRIFNLLRDDLGGADDLSGLNYEVAFSRGAPAGEYTVNLHLYRGDAGQLPTPVEVTVGVKSRPETRPAPIGRERIALTRVGEEATAIRFTLDASGNLVPGSDHRLPRPLRAAGR
jgi:hypothetical protein